MPLQLHSRSARSAQYLSRRDRQVVELIGVDVESSRLSVARQLGHCHRSAEDDVGPVLREGGADGECVARDSAGGCEAVRFRSPSGARRPLAIASFTITIHPFSAATASEPCADRSRMFHVVCTAVNGDDGRVSAVRMVSA